MTQQEAITLLIDIASRWGENAEEGFPRRVKATDTDEDCRKLAQIDDKEPDTWEVEDVIEVRNLWQAIAVLESEHIKDPILGDLGLKDTPTNE